MFTTITVLINYLILILFLLASLRNVLLFFSPITNIVSLSFSSGQFRPIIKKSTISPLLKDQLPNYRHISSLSLISSIIEHIVRYHLTHFLSSNNLLNSHQSAYCKHHSTETDLLHIHDHLINAILFQKISCLCLLDLSAAF